VGNDNCLHFITNNKKLNGVHLCLLNAKHVAELKKVISELGKALTGAFKCRILIKKQIRTGGEKA
jgi:hypothetical protein